MHAFIRALLVSLLLVGTAQASDYYFKVRGGEPYGLTNSYTSATSACAAWKTAMEGVWGSDWTIETTTEATSTEGSFSCTTTRTRGADKYNNNGVADRYGDACPANSVYNTSTGACDVQSQCTALKDQNFAWGYKTAVGYVTNGGKHGVGEHVNKDGCEATTGSFQCDAASDGSDYGYCTGVATYTGLNATASDANVGATTLGNDPNKNSDTNCGTGYTWSGSTCVKNPDKDTGTGDTGTGTGEGTGTGDGTGSGGSTGGGSAGGGSTGDGTGTGTGTGTGDGTGTGTGTGTGDDDSDDDGDSTDSKVGGEACSSSLTCSGDAIQCAILRQARTQQCAQAEWNDYSKAKDTINSAVAGKEYQLEESKTDVSGGFDTGTRFLSASCPSPKSWHSDSFGRSFQISYQPACDYASTISALVLAMASLFFIVYVGRGFGGD